MSDFAPQQRTKTVLDDPKLKLEAPPIEGGTSPATLSVYFTGNNPRIDVYTNKPGDKENGLIRGKLDVRAMDVMFSCLESLYHDPEDKTTYIIELKDYTWNAQRQRSAEPVVTATIIIGKDNDGRIYISLLSRDRDRPKIRFYFGLNFYTWVGKLVNGQKEPMTDAEISRRVARKWCNRVSEMYTTVATRDYVHKTREDRTQSRQQHGPGRRNDGASGQSAGPAPVAAAADDFGDDLPF